MKAITQNEKTEKASFSSAEKERKNVFKES